jgi:hypothetical protein
MIEKRLKRPRDPAALNSGQTLGRRSPVNNLLPSVEDSAE